ncbi:hypothetical protein M9979_12240 [Sphingomonas sp. RP10(2022)]|uniref:Uncharacterized protein n=1 Tax=Sphingomonas liriopis TaxID=2949094 RepID=A0A9X2KU65_9SPHN|nr:hypothetical protein [Sphingomonas liriopis]MCP3735643.1 hypothetical protein [Sphingomonas liriopis]
MAEKSEDGMSVESVALPDWHNADTCIENMQIAYDDATEADPFDDGNPIPIDTVVDAGDLGVLIGLARYAVAHRLSSAPAAGDPRAWLTSYNARNYGGEEGQSGAGYTADDMLAALQPADHADHRNRTTSPAGEGSRTGVNDFAAPAGWKLVPVEPTEAMLGAAYLCGDGGSPRTVYGAMLAAAPSPAVQDAEGGVGLREALQAQEDAEDKRETCVNCEGEGQWEHCPSCSLTFGRAIDLRRAALSQGGQR